MPAETHDWDSAIQTGSNFEEFMFSTYLSTN